MAVRVTYFHRWFPSAIRGQKKRRRAILGLLKPIRCKTCRLFTRQVRVRKPWGRKCLGCGQQIAGSAAPSVAPKSWLPWRRVAV